MGGLSELDPDVQDDNRPSTIRSGAGIKGRGAA